MNTVFRTALSRLVGVSVGAIVSYFIAHKQITASVVLANRENWVNTLSDRISEFQSLIVPITLERVFKNIENEKHSL